MQSTQQELSPAYPVGNLPILGWLTYSVKPCACTSSLVVIAHLQRPSFEDTLKATELLVYNRESGENPERHPPLFTGSRPATATKLEGPS